MPQYSVNHEEESSEECSTALKFCDIGVNTDLTMHDIEDVKMKVDEIEDKLEKTEAKFDKQLFCLENIHDDGNKVNFYAGFATFAVLMVCFNVLGSAVDKLIYRFSGTSERKSNKGWKRLLSPLNEFFLLLVRLRLELFEQDLAYRFGISQSSVSRILITWINFV